MAGYKKVKVPEEPRVVTKEEFDSQLSGEALKSGLVPTDLPVEGTNFLENTDDTGYSVVRKKGQLPV